MLPEQFVYVASAVILVGDLTYLIQSLRGRVQPNRVTWFLWGLVPLIAFIVQMVEGVGLVALFTLALALMPILIFCSTFLHRGAVWRLTGLDYGCGAASAVAVVAWLVSGSGQIAIAFLIAADVMAGLPTVRKAFLAPRTESSLPYWAALVASLMTVGAVEEFTFTNTAFPLYVASVCWVIAALVQFRLGERYLARR